MIEYNGLQYEVTELETVNINGMECKRFRVQIWDMEGIVQYDKEKTGPTHRYSLDDYGKRYVRSVVKRNERRSS